MNVIQGPGLGQEALVREDRRLRSLQIAVEWARSAGQEHCTRVPIDEFIKAASKIDVYLREDSYVKDD